MGSRIARGALGFSLKHFQAACSGGVAPSARLKTPNLPKSSIPLQAPSRMAKLDKGYWCRTTFNMFSTPTLTLAQEDSLFKRFSRRSPCSFLFVCSGFSTHSSVKYGSCRVSEVLERCDPKNVSLDAVETTSTSFVFQHIGLVLIPTEKLRYAAKKQKYKAVQKVKYLTPVGYFTGYGRASNVRKSFSLPMVKTKKAPINMSSIPPERSW